MMRRIQLASHLLKNTIQTTTTTNNISRPITNTLLSTSSSSSSSLINQQQQQQQQERSIISSSTTNNGSLLLYHHHVRAAGGAATTSIIGFIGNVSFFSSSSSSGSSRLPCKQPRGRMKGISHRGNRISFGTYALQALESAWITSRQIEAGRKALVRYVRRGGKTWVRIFPDKPVTAKPTETRMGRGKGNFKCWVSVVKPGRILYEIDGVSETVAREAISIAASKMPIRTQCLIPSSLSRGGRAGFAGAVSFSSLAASNPGLIPKDVVLYQYEACPFCNKIKAFLDYYDIPYKVVEVNPISKKEIKWSDYKKVPILMVDGQQMVDSSEIIDMLEHKLHPEKKYVDPTDDNDENKWRRWVDNHLVHMLSPNIYRTTSEALESFDYITSHGNFSFMERITAKYAGAAAMYFVSKKLKKRHNITDERASLYEAAETWVNALDGREFLGGSKPNLGDLSVFGVLRPIRYLKSGRDMVEHTRIGEWYTRMEKAVGEPARIKS